MIRLNIIVAFLLLLSCDHKYSKGVQKDTQRIIESQKNFINSISFNGTIYEKKICENCQMNKYQIVILLKDINPVTIKLSNQTFQPYFAFTKNQLALSVTPSLYGSAKEGEGIMKEKASSFLIINDKKYRLLSERKFQWLPDKNNK